MVEVAYDPDPMIFPSQAWFVAYEDRVNDSETYKKQGEGWGVGFNGDFIFEMTHMPLDEMNTEKMPEYLREEFDTYLTETDDRGYVGRAFMGLEDGRCTEGRLIEEGDNVEAGFQLSATNDTWKELLDGEREVIEGLMSGDFELDGDMQKVLQYSDAAVTLTELAADIDAEYAEERF